MNRFEVKAALGVDDDGVITGLAWPFGTPDRVGDMIEKGAFGSPAKLPMLFAHDPAQLWACGKRQRKPTPAFR